MRLSKSSPPRCVSPDVDLTSKSPFSIVRMETSNVPPPRSKMRIFFSVSVFLSSPKAMAAAVGSLIILRTLRPEIVPASFVAYLYESLKQAGTVTTASFTLLPKKSSAISFIFNKTIEEIYSGKNFSSFPLYQTDIKGFSSAPQTILKGHILISYWTMLSQNFLPIRRLAS